MHSEGDTAAPAISPPVTRADLLSLFREAPARERLQVWARWWTCPLAEVLRDLPPRGRILEVGCGRGVTSMYLALRHPDRQIVATDVDADKIDLAVGARRHLGTRDGRVHLEVRPAGDLPPGPFDGVVFNDVLYLMPAPARQAVLDGVVERLAPGGVIVIKEDDVAPRWKHRVNLAHNFVLRRLLGNLEGETVDLWPSAAYRGALEDRGLSVTVRLLGHGYPYAHFLVTARQPPAS